MKILVAEDDANLGFLLVENLTSRGYEATLCRNGKEGLEKFSAEKFDFCILDIMMPVMDGLTLAKEIRKLNKSVPILFLTAKNLQEDKLSGFRLGGDDYMTKPFSMEELHLRIHAIMRRVYGSTGKTHEDSVFRFGNTEFDSRRQVLTIGKKIFELTSKESELLKLLCLSLNQVVDRPYALKLIWGDDSYFNARSMDVYVTKLRKYLKNDPSAEILNIHGVGFKLVVK